MLKIKIKPISSWVGAETKTPRNSQFKQTYSNTKKILESELEKLNAIESSIEIEMFIHSDDLRQDGELRANARPYKPGVKLSFLYVVRRFRDEAGNYKAVTQNLTYPCDAFDSWQDNLRAIALSLEALRKVERYGVFKYADIVSRLALPSAEGKIFDRQAAAEFISKFSDYPPHAMSGDDLKKAYRQALASLHPDKPNGNLKLFLQLQEAYRLLS